MALTNCGLRQTFRLTAANNQLRVTQAGGAGSATVTIPAGSYTWTTFETALESALATAMGEPYVGGIQLSQQPSIFTLSTGLSSPGGVFSLDFSHPDWSLDPRILGFAATQATDVTAVSASGGAWQVVPPYTPRYVWHPHRYAMDGDFLRVVADRIHERSRFGTRSVQTVASWTEGELVVEFVPTGHVVAAVASSAERMAAAQLAQYDPNAALETFIADHLDTGSTIQFRPQESSSTGEITGLRIDDDQLMRNPLALCVMQDGGMQVTCRIPLATVPS